MFLDELGARIRERREKRGLKQHDIAGALQVSPQAVSKWERGENAPDLATLGPLARLLDVTTDWLLGVHTSDPNGFEATVLATSIQGAYDTSRRLSPVEFAAWANGLFHTLTEAVLRHDGVPVKYMGDQFLSFFSGPGHAKRALAAARLARRLVREDLRVGLNTGAVYLGSVGHGDYARPDIMGEAVNLAFLTLSWAERASGSGIAAADATLQQLDPTERRGKAHALDFKGIPRAVQVCELKLED